MYFKKGSKSEDHNLSLPDSDDKKSKPLKKIRISDFDKSTSQKTTGSYKDKSSKRSLKQTPVSGDLTYVYKNVFIYLFEIKL